MRTRPAAIACLTALAVGLAATTVAMAGVGAAALAHCREFAFSTSEDFVTQGPEPPDGNPIISDGDLLGLVYTNGTAQCAVCARNSDLLSGFDVNVDLGLDAVDVLDVDAAAVVFSTELDSPNAGQFTAGDLLILGGGVIPNRALTYLFGPAYDLGLDALGLVGAEEDIASFLTEARTHSRTDWLSTPDLLVQILGYHGVDIWFSTEGSWMPASGPRFLDGDVLSAVNGAIVAAHKDLLPPSVPAGLPARGVDFGLDALTSDRTAGTAAIHFSTEILYDGTPRFTDGDVLACSNSVAVSNAALTACFEPMALELGLDALSVAPREQAQGGVSRLTKIGGVDVADISPADGTVLPGTLGINAPVPFGGRIDFRGALRDDADKFRVVYRKAGSGDPWEPIAVLPSKGWEVRVDAFLPPWPDCLDSQGWFSDADGWFSGPDYRHLTDAALGGCNPDLPLTVWESGLATSGGDALYEVALETMASGMVVTDTTYLVQLDNTAPTVELEKNTGVCVDLSGTNMPHAVQARIRDAHFHEYSLAIAGDGYGSHSYPPVAYYHDPADSVIETGTTNWNAFVGLHAIDVTDLSPTPTACGYAVTLTGWDRTLWCDFDYPSSLVTRCLGCRSTADIWIFRFSP